MFRDRSSQYLSYFDVSRVSRATHSLGGPVWSAPTRGSLGDLP